MSLSSSGAAARSLAAAAVKAMRQPGRGHDDYERDDSPSVLVPSLHAYLKTSKLPALGRNRRLDVLRRGDPVCRSDSLLRITELCEENLQAGRLLAG